MMYIRTKIISFSTEHWQNDIKPIVIRRGLFEENSIRTKKIKGVFANFLVAYIPPSGNSEVKSLSESLDRNINLKYREVFNINAPCIGEAYGHKVIIIREYDRFVLGCVCLKTDIGTLGSFTESLVNDTNKNLKFKHDITKDKWRHYLEHKSDYVEIGSTSLFSSLNDKSFLRKKSIRLETVFNMDACLKFAIQSCIERDHFIVASVRKVYKHAKFKGQFYLYNLGSPDHDLETAKEYRRKHDIPDTVKKKNALDCRSRCVIVDIKKPNLFYLKGPFFVYEVVRRFSCFIGGTRRNAFRLGKVCSDKTVSTISKLV